MFKFELSDFQKWAIYGLLNNKNVLITAHTGSGKTVPAEAAIRHFTSMGKYVIYTSPIKALTNQNIKLGEYYKRVLKKGLEEFTIKTDKKEFKVLPCYFPVGRGNPKRACEMLKRIKNRGLGHSGLSLRNGTTYT